MATINLQTINFQTINLGPDEGSGSKIEKDVTLSVTANGSYTISPDEGYDAIADAKVIVDSKPKLEDKSIEVNENTTVTVTADSGYDGLGNVTVNTNVPNMDIPGMIYSYPMWYKQDTNSLATITHAIENGDIIISPRKDLECENMFYENTELTSVPLFDTSKCTSVKQMFASEWYSNNYMNITELPLFDTSNVTDMSDFCYMCDKLTSFPKLNTSKVTTMNGAFAESGITELHQLDTSRVTDMTNMFAGFNKYRPGVIVTVPLIDMTNVTKATGMFNYCTSLTNLGGFKNLSVSLDLSASTAITADSMVNVFNNLATVTTSTALTLGETNLAKLTDEEKAIATGKGWTLN